MIFLVNKHHTHKLSTLSKTPNLWLNPIVISAKPMNKRCKISKVCSRKSYSERNKRDSLAYDIYDRLQETKRGNITQHYCSISIPVVY